MQTNDLVSCSGVLALELSADTQPRQLALERDDADTLANFISDDLRKLLPGIEAGKMGVIGAHFDSTELLRPDFPIYTTLEELTLRIDEGVVAFGTHQGHMPAKPFVPDPDLAGGALRLIPWSVLLKPELAEKLGPDMEVELVGRGEAGEKTSDFLMRHLGIKLEHARYFSRHDIMALVCVHYEHVNLAPLWQLIEAALLRPSSEETVMSAHGLTWQYKNQHAYPQVPGQWLAHHDSSADQKLAHELAGILFELRQYAALLAAHHIPLEVDGAKFNQATGSIIETIQEPQSTASEKVLYAHQAAGLGVIALTLAELSQNKPQALVRIWPLAPQLKALCEHLATTYGCPAKPVYIEDMEITGDGKLALPAREQLSSQV